MGFAVAIERGIIIACRRIVWPRVPSYFSQIVLRYLIVRLTPRRDETRRDETRRNDHHDHDEDEDNITFYHFFTTPQRFDLNIIDVAYALLLISSSLRYDWLLRCDCAACQFLSSFADGYVGLPRDMSAFHTHFALLSSSSKLITLKLCK